MRAALYHCCGLEGGKLLLHQGLGDRGWAKWMSHTLPSSDASFEVPLSKPCHGLVATNQKSALGSMLQCNDVVFCEFKLSRFLLKP